MTERVADVGPPHERTELAWRRTALAFAIGSLLAIRLLPVALGSAAWVVPGILGVSASGLLWWAGRRRYLAQSAALRHPGTPTPDGRLLLGVAAFATIAGLAAVAVVVVTFGAA